MKNIIKIDKVKTFENKLIIGFNVPKELENISMKMKFSSNTISISMIFQIINSCYLQYYSNSLGN